ncbi:hypothetical protein N2152v2_002737 [Parachlorella kessleri]
MQAIWDANNHAALFLQGNQRYEQPTYCLGQQQQEQHAITKYVEREILNHRRLRHPHIIDLREVRACVALIVVVVPGYGRAAAAAAGRGGGLGSDVGPLPSAGKESVCSSSWRRVAAAAGGLTLAIWELGGVLGKAAGSLRSAAAAQPKRRQRQQQQRQLHQRLSAGRWRLPSRHGTRWQLCAAVFLTDDHLVLVMEYAAGGDLLERVARSRWLSEEEARWFFQQTMFAIDYCHRMGVANRDVKLENTLLKDRSPRPLVKLADFGFSKDENYQSAPGSRVGTPAYLAPEVISNVEGQHYDAKQADVWSCGVMLYTMVTGRYPFQRPEDQQWQPGLQLHHMLQRILHVIFDFPPGLPLTDDCKDLISRMLVAGGPKVKVGWFHMWDLISRMLVADPARRVTVQQVLQHPWCTKGMHTELHAYNDKFVEKTLANPPSPEELDTITKIVQEAATGPKREQGQQGAAGSAAAAVAGAAAGAADGGLPGQGAVGGAGPMPTIKDDESGSEGGFDDDVLDPDSIDFDFEPV